MDSLKSFASNFLRLPIELRIEIYKLTLDHSTSWHASEAIPLGQRPFPDYDRNLQWTWYTIRSMTRWHYATSFSRISPIIQAEVEDFVLTTPSKCSLLWPLNSLRQPLFCDLDTFGPRLHMIKIVRIIHAKFEDYWMESLCTIITELRRRLTGLEHLAIGIEHHAAPPYGYSKINVENNAAHLVHYVYGCIREAIEGVPRVEVSMSFQEPRFPWGFEMIDDLLQKYSKPLQDGFVMRAVWDKWEFVENKKGERQIYLDGMPINGEKGGGQGYEGVMRSVWAKCHGSYCRFGPGLRLFIHEPMTAFRDLYLVQLRRSGHQVESTSRKATFRRLHHERLHKLFPKAAKAHKRLKIALPNLILDLQP